MINRAIHESKKHNLGLKECIIVLKKSTLGADQNGTIDPNAIEIKDSTGKTEYSREVLVSIVQNLVHESEGLDIARYKITDLLKFSSGRRKAIEIATHPEGISIDLTLDFKLREPIHALSARIRENVKHSIESMTGLVVSTVNVHVSDIKRNPLQKLLPIDKKTEDVSSAKPISQAGIDLSNHSGDIDQVEQRN